LLFISQKKTTHIIANPGSCTLYSYHSSGIAKIAKRIPPAMGLSHTCYHVRRWPHDNPSHPTLSLIRVGKYFIHRPPTASYSILERIISYEPLSSPALRMNSLRNQNLESVIVSFHPSGPYRRFWERGVFSSTSNLSEIDRRTTDLSKLGKGPGRATGGPFSTARQF